MKQTRKIFSAFFFRCESRVLQRSISLTLQLYKFRCKSFNYLSVEKICELNNEDRNSVEVREYVQIGQNWLESVNGLVAYEGSQYFSRNAYALKSKVRQSVKQIQ